MKHSTDPDTTQPVMRTADAPPRCFYEGLWGHAGMFLWNERGAYPREAGGVEYLGRGDERMRLDSSLAPRRMKRTGALRWCAMRAKAEWPRIHYNPEEYPLAQFLRHTLDTDLTPLHW